ncbi:hypothetical protein QO002_001085 [Pararhizobium capsulatum DSM 1112]|uniref:Solute-binding protein family 3/N-terminal domain-containing protein n=1 Tax=Pararhizobium capsulatum DSM 1112 TaxID=1121113 RepID=A0ABU0BLR8_9HYPH|nr:hypothetical protein [Pararhizobium capsulatum]MDQ0318947.1 hypothetical protein [Pararhizobium capsulatum DSM 1112]
MGEKTDVWPADVPAQLWNYDLLQPATDRPFPLPLMGMKPDWVFVGYYAVGIAIILMFAWKRFNKRTFGTSPDDYLVLQELSPTELRGTGKMVQAYCYYAGILLLIYSGFALFGNLIVAALKSTDIAGLQVTIDPTSLGSRSWPITLALAFAGFTELFRPIDVMEVWLRRQAHHWVGIPTRVMARTERLLHVLDDEMKVTAGKNDPSGPDGRRLPAWAIDHIRKKMNVGRLMQKYKQLKGMAALVQEPGSWPDISLLNTVKPLAKKVSLEAEAALLNFEEVLNLNTRLETISDDKPPPAKPGESVAPGSAESAEQVAARNREKRLQMLDAAIAAVNKSRRETGALLTVYAERDAQKAGLGQTPIEKAIKTAFPSEPPTDIGFWLLFLLMPIFFLYATMTGFGMHGMISNVKTNLITILATAAAETFRLVAIFLLPLLAVVALRSYLKEINRWRPLTLGGFNRAVPMQAIAVGLVAAVVATIALTGFSLGVTAVVAENRDRFRTILFSARPAAIPYYLSYAFCAVFFTLITIWAVDSLLEVKSRPKAFGFGVLNAFVVMLLMAIHFLMWTGRGCGEFSCLFTTIGERLSSSATLSDVYAQLNLTDFVAYFAIGFLSAGLFAFPSTAEDTGKDGADRPHSQRILGAAWVMLAAVALLLLLVPTPLLAGGEGSAPASRSKRVVYVGVRTNAEPFSYKAGKGREQIGLAYRGYAVDLCYQILEGAGYSVEFVPVTPRNRFSLIRKEPGKDGDWSVADKAKPVVDILCEPTTLRFNRTIEDSKGIFSPIIFATGVSSIMRSSRAPNASDTYLAYVDGTTAGFVADKACKNDMFAIYDEAASDGTDCSPVLEPTRESFRDGRMLYADDCNPTTQSASVVDPKSPKDKRVSVQPKARYHVCAFASHDEVIEWFCNFSDRALKARIVYFGDQEIIRAKLASARAEGRCPEGGIEPQSASYTYEPYALLMSNTDPELVQVVQRGVYDFFSHRSKAIGLFSTYFPGAEMSPVLAYLFLLNAVEDEIFFQVPYLERERTIYATQKGAYLFGKRNGQ